MEYNYKIIDFRLIYSYYVNPNDIYNIIYKWHLININDNLEIFDFVDIYLLVDDVNNAELIENVKQFILSYLTKLNEFNIRLNFYIEQNHGYFREGKIFKSYLIDKLKDYKNELVFFAHTKGRQNIEDGLQLNNLLTWIGTMYCMNLNIGYFEMRNYLLNDDYSKITFGAIYNYSLRMPLKYHWMYIGGFLWVNPERFLKYCSDNNIDYYNKLNALNIHIRNSAESLFPNVMPKEYASYYDCNRFNMEYCIGDYEPNKLPYNNISYFINELLTQDTYNLLQEYLNKLLNKLNQSK